MVNNNVQYNNHQKTYEPRVKDMMCIELLNKQDDLVYLEIGIRKSCAFKTWAEIASLDAW
jgi:hypothetical protein